MSQYFEWDVFQNIYLEDSFVLDIAECGGCVSFTLELVLTEDHPQYESPQAEEMYCYKKGKIVFDEVKQVEWLSRNLRSFVDAENTKDFGNIDYLLFGERGYELAGDWGHVVIQSREPHIAWLE